MSNDEGDEFVGVCARHRGVSQKRPTIVRRAKSVSSVVLRISNGLDTMRCICFAVVVAITTTLFAEPSPTPGHIVSHISREPVQSSAIAKVGYSKRRHILEIEFVNGAVYRYLDIPLSVHRDLMSAESKAHFYDSNIRKHYRSVLIRPREQEQQ